MKYPENPILLTETSRGVLTLTLNRPQALNALNQALMGILLETLGMAKDDDGVRVVVLTGSGRGFSAGQDLRELEPNWDIAEHMRRYYTPLIETLATYPKPTVAQVNGVAAGAGAGLALACDFKVMEADAHLVLAFSHLGLVLDSGTTYFLVRSMGRTRAMAAALLGEPITAASALELGLVNYVGATEEIGTVAAAWARHLAQGPQLSFRLIKEAMLEAEHASLSTVLATEARNQAIAFQSDDHRRALAAFLNKEPSPFAADNESREHPRA